MKGLKLCKWLRAKRIQLNILKFICSLYENDMVLNNMLKYKEELTLFFVFYILAPCAFIRDSLFPSLATNCPRPVNKNRVNYSLILQ